MKTIKPDPLRPTLTEQDLKEMLWSSDIHAYCRVRQAMTYPTQQRINEVAKAITDLQVVLLDEFGIPPFQLFRLCNASFHSVREVLEVTVAKEPAYKK